MDKDKIKTLSSTVRQLELRCEELQRHLDDIVLRRDHNDDTDHTDNDRDVGEEMVERTDVNCQVTMSCKIFATQFCTARIKHEL